MRETYLVYCHQTNKERDNKRNRRPLARAVQYQREIVCPAGHSRPVTIDSSQRNGSVDGRPAGRSLFAAPCAQNQIRNQIPYASPCQDSPPSCRQGAPARLNRNLGRLQPLIYDIFRYQFDNIWERRRNGRKWVWFTSFSRRLHVCFIGYCSGRCSVSIQHI